MATNFEIRRAKEIVYGQEIEDLSYIYLGQFYDFHIFDYIYALRLYCT